MVDVWEGFGSEIASRRVFSVDIALLVRGLLEQSEYTMQTSPAPSTGLFGATKPAWLPSSDLVRSEHQFAFKGTRYKCCKKTAVQRGTPSFIWQYGTEARASESSYPYWLCNACWDK